MTNWVKTRGEPAMSAASAGVVLPPKLKSALPPTTACMEGAWFGKGPSHSTLMPSLASSLSNSPRSLATRLRPLRPQVRRTRSVVRPAADRALSSPARAPMPNAAAPRKRRRDDEKSDITQVLIPLNLSSGVGNDTKFGQKIAARDRSRTGSLDSGSPGLMLERDRAVAHHEDTVGERDGLVDVMRHQQHARPVLGDQFTHQIMHADARQRIERREGLVQQQKLWFLHQGPRQRDALSLSAGQIARPVVETIAKSDLGERGGNPRIGVGCSEAQRNVAPKRIPRQQARFLKYHRRPPRRHDASALDRIETGERPQQRGLAAAAFPEQGDEFAAFDPQVEIADDNAVSIGATEIAHHHGKQVGRRGRMRSRNLGNHRDPP